MARYDDAWGRVGRWGYDRPFQQPEFGRNEGYGGAGPGRWRPTETSDPHQCCGGEH